MAAIYHSTVTRVFCNQRCDVDPGVDLVFHLWVRQELLEPFLTDEGIDGEHDAPGQEHQGPGHRLEEG